MQLQERKCDVISAFFSLLLVWDEEGFRCSQAESLSSLLKSLGAESHSATTDIFYWKPVAL